MPLPSLFLHGLSRFAADVSTEKQKVLMPEEAVFDGVIHCGSCGTPV